MTPEQRLSSTADLQRPLAADPMMPLPFRVVEKRFKRPDCTLLTVKPADETCLCVFKPGQFYMLYVFGHGEVPVSANGDPDCRGSLDFTIKNVGSVTAALCALETGDMIGLRGPFGSAWPLEKTEGNDIVIMAGGLGCAPLRPVIHHLMAHRDKYGEVSLLYGVRRPENVLFANEMETWKKHIHVRLTADTAEHGWRESVGLVTELVKSLDILPARTAALVCGPEKMMQFSANALIKKGLQPPQIHVSMERNMKCAIGHCGRCQYGPHFICKDGPVFSFDRIQHLLKIGEV